MQSEYLETGAFIIIGGAVLATIGYASYISYLAYKTSKRSQFLKSGQPNNLEKIVSNSNTPKKETKKEPAPKINDD